MIGRIVVPRLNCEDLLGPMAKRNGHNRIKREKLLILRMELILIIWVAEGTLSVEEGGRRQRGSHTETGQGATHCGFEGWGRQL